MNTPGSAFTIRLIGILAIVLFYIAPGLSANEEALLIPVEQGMRLIRVEAFDSATGRWQVVAAAHVDGQPGTVKVRVPAGLDHGNLRISASDEAMFPTTFVRDRDTVRTRQPAEEETSIRYGRSGAWLGSDVAAGAAPESDGIAEDEVTVEESDIWRIAGNRLYFFNRARGLQIFDLSNPDDPARLGSLELAGRGEQMYLLDENHVVLVGTSPQVDIIVVRVENGEPVEVARSGELPGSYLESRLVGDRLYYATVEYAWSADDAAHSYVHVGGLDLTNPAEPVAFTPLRLDVNGSWNQIVTATPTHLLLSASRQFYEESEGEWWRSGWHDASEVFLIDLDTQDGSPSLVGSVVASGRVSNKHNLHFENNVLTTIAQASGQAQGVRYQNTVLETFVLQEGTLNSAGDLELAPDETLFATLFHGNRAYVVTFFQIDPLFVIDLSDPTNPSLLGELDVPGFSNVLRMLDSGRLFSVGVESGRVAASLFAVDDPDNLKLLSRAYIGDAGDVTWSEASYDDRAVTVLEEAGLVLLPFQTSTVQGQSSGIQIFSLGPDTLQARGQIMHENYARRAAALDAETLVSISETELFTIRVANLDEPAVLAHEQLAWHANRLYRFGEYLVQADTTSSSLSGQAELTITNVESPDLSIENLELPYGRNVGFAQKGDWLYALSLEHSYDPAQGTVSPASLRVTAIDFANPPVPKIEGTSTAPVLDADLGWPNRFKAVWLEEDTVLWVTTRETTSWGGPEPMNPLLAIDERAFAGDAWIYPYYASHRPTLLTHSITNPAQPALLDAVIYDHGHEFWEVSGSEIHVDGAKAFFSWTRGWYEPALADQWQFRLEQKLVAVDLSDPADLRFEEPLEINGELKAVDPVVSDGRILFTTESRWDYDPDTNTSRPIHRVRAYAYDGVQLLDVDEVDWVPMPQRDNFSYSLLLEHDRRTLYQPVSGETDSEVARLTLTNEGRFEEGDSLPFRGSQTFAFGRSGGRLFAFSDEATAVWDLRGNEPPVREDFESAYPAPVNFAADRVLYRTGEGVLLANDYYGVLSLAVADHAPDGDEGAGSALPPEAQITHIALSAAEFSLPGQSDAVGIIDERRWLFRPAAMSGPDPDAEDRGDGWRVSAWLGWYFESESGSWIYHLEHGWNYSFGTSNGAWLYDTVLGWYWATESAYPFVYSHDRGSWIYYLEGSGPHGLRWFYDYHPDAKAWFSVGRS